MQGRDYAGTSKDSRVWTTPACYQTSANLIHSNSLDPACPAARTHILHVTRHPTSRAVTTASDSAFTELGQFSEMHTKVLITGLLTVRAVKQGHTTADVDAKLASVVTQTWQQALFHTPTNVITVCALDVSMSPRHISKVKRKKIK